MATIYVSYKREEQPFVSDVVSRLGNAHEIFIDYTMPKGVDSRSHMQERLRTAEVFLVFVSRGIPASEYQLAEIGAARFCSAFLDQKLILPIVIDPMDIPRPLQDLDCMIEPGRDPAATADEILAAIQRRVRRIQLFISHSHKDEDLASRLVEAITSGLDVPADAMRCTSVSGYQLDLGAMAPEALRRELGSAACVVAILSPNSLEAEWVLFELGAAWASGKTAIPLLIGGLADKDIPGPLRGAAGGNLGDPLTLYKLLDQLHEILRWQRKYDLPAQKKLLVLAKYAAEKDWPPGKSGDLGKKVAYIGSYQKEILDYVTNADSNTISQRELEDKFKDVPTHVFFRLEQLRLLGFLERIKIGNIFGEPTFDWSLSAEYREHRGR